MAVFHVEKNKNYTVMSNVHLKDRSLPLKAKGLLSLILSLPDGWDFTLKGPAKLSADGLDSTRSAIRALEKSGYIIGSSLHLELVHSLMSLRNVDLVVALYSVSLLFFIPGKSDTFRQESIISFRKASFNRFRNKTPVSFRKSTKKLEEQSIIRIFI